MQKRKTNRRYSEEEALSLVSLFKDAHPDQTQPDGTDRELQHFMEAQTIETARHWRRMWERRQGVTLTYV